MITITALTLTAFATVALIGRYFDREAHEIQEPASPDSAANVRS